MYLGEWKAAFLKWYVFTFFVMWWINWVLREMYEYIGTTLRRNP